MPIQGPIRINRRIRANQVRVIDEDGKQLGIMSLEEGLREAEERELDLVELSPNSNPPVCRIMDYGKYIYQQNKRAQRAKRSQRATQLKEIKFRPKISEHDYQFKKRHILRFLSAGNLVKVTVMFRGRELAHLELGDRILDRLIIELEEVANFEKKGRLEGRNLSMLISPKKL
ncbi:translation initiation factor IF-3 [bacterium (candidate division B38) B3_B38]|nr:MAG: translation initiation factor IF-3 [bacterium (candidate division B38) B3_B38]